MAGKLACGGFVPTSFVVPSPVPLVCAGAVDAPTQICCTVAALVHVMSVAKGPVIALFC